jgi:hypothetical protein
MIRPMKHVPACAALAILTLTGAAAAPRDRPVVVELYTSQGCSACLPADALLAKLAQRKDVIALTMPVTYWDILGWKDTFAHEGDNKRQKAYAEALGHGGVYTPQLVADGAGDVVGSREDKVKAAIEAARKGRDCSWLEPAPNDAAPPRRHGRNPGCQVEIGLTRGKSGVDISVELERGGLMGVKPAAKVWLLALRRHASVNVGSGENKGRTLSYVNVVDKIKTAGKWEGAPAAFTVSYDGVKMTAASDFVVLVQLNGYGRVVGAGYFSAPGTPAP